MAEDFREEKERSPKEFAQLHNINVQNVYFWIKENQDKDWAYKNQSGRWMVTVEGQKGMLEKDKERTPFKRYAKQPHSKGRRKRNTESPDSIVAKLQCSRQTAQMIHKFIDPEFAEQIIGVIEAVAEFKDEYKDTHEHDRILLMLAKIMGRSELGAITTHDGYEFFKYVVPESAEDYTVVYNIRTQVFWMDIPGKIVENNPELELRGMGLEV